VVIVTTAAAPSLSAAVAAAARSNAMTPVTFRRHVAAARSAAMWRRVMNRAAITRWRRAEAARRVIDAYLAGATPADRRRAQRLAQALGVDL
jgi:hypothetical protein